MDTEYELQVARATFVIERYCQIHPLAADGLAGVCFWSEELRGFRREIVEEALARLIRNGRVRCHVLGDGQRLYGCNDVPTPCEYPTTQGGIRIKKER